MTDLIQSSETRRAAATHPDELSQYLTVTIAGKTLGIPVLRVHDVLGSQRITRIPLAPRAVLGSLNLRGRIVTAIDVRRRLGLAERGAERTSMSVVVEHGGDLYSLVVDSVGDVLSLAGSELAPTPVTVTARWQEVSRGVYRLPDQLLVIVDIDRLLADVSDTERTAPASIAA
jgi:purine-binding chemotaxis protein CheW